MTPEIATFKKPWYNVNFTNDLYFNNKTTRFLRIAIPPHKKENVTEEDAPNPRKYFITLVPVYSYSENKIIKNGFLYNWYTLKDPRGLINTKDGWRIPSDNDWKRLEKYIDGEWGSPENWDNDGMRGYVIGRRLKYSHEWDDIIQGTNDFNFSALPSGFRDYETSKLQNNTDLDIYLNFNETGGNIVYDNSGNGNNGNIIDDVLRVEGKYDKAIKFDKNGRIDTNFKIKDTNFTISLWVELFNINGDEGYIINQWEDGHNGRLALTQTGENLLNFRFGEDLSKTIELEKGKNHILFGRRNNDELFLCINGKEKWSIINNNEIADKTFQIGGTNRISNRNSKSIIDDVRIYSKGLTEKQSKLLYEGEFKNIKEKCYWWSSSENNNSEAWCRMLTTMGETGDNNKIGRFSESKKQGFSIRCVRDYNKKIDANIKDGEYSKDYIGNDGTRYKTIRIGNQIWTAENLIETQWRDNTKIIEPCNKNLKGHWNFNEEEGDIVYDQSTNDNNGNININEGLRYISSIHKEGWRKTEFTNNSAINISDNNNISFNNNDNFTISIWANIKDSNKRGALIHKGFLNHSYGISYYDKSLSVGVRGAQSAQTIEVSDNYTPVEDSIYLYTLVYDSSNSGRIKFYINGIFHQEKNIPNFSFSNNNEWQILSDFGLTGNSSGSKIKGFVDDIRIYSRALSSEEVLNLYKCNKDKENDYWIKVNELENSSFSIYENKTQNAYIENNLSNREFEKSQYYINGVNIKPMFVDIKENLSTYDCFNIYGPTEDLIFGNMYNHFKCISRDQWQEIEEGDTWEYRIDYLGEKDENVKFVFFITEFFPRISDFIHTNLDWSDSSLYNEPPIPNELIPHEDIIPYSLKYSKYGIKSINNYLFSHNNFNYISLKAKDPYYKKPHLPYKIDYIDIDIYGKGYLSGTVKENISLYNKEDNILYNDKSSNLLLRTNPKLSGNVKLTIDSKGNLWFNSIDANNELSNVKFKKYKISPNSTYSADLYNFFDNGETPSDTIFYLNEYDDTYQYSKTEYHLQYDNFYGYGVKQVESKFYNEEFSLFAPLWLKKQLPEFFVIFKVDHPINKFTYDNLNNKETLDELLKNAMIIKTFDMREGTNVGQYLRNIINERNFKEQPLYITYDSESLSTWNGASLKDGTVASKGEYLYDVFTKDRTIKEFEEYITLGFMRNNIICQNLINFEFLFNDEISDDYTINRYFGLFMNEIELDKFNTNEKILSQIEDQTPQARIDVNVYEGSMIPFEQTNKNGIILPVKESNMGYLDFENDKENKLYDLTKEKNKFFVIKDKETQFRRIKNISNQTSQSTHGKINYKEITLFDKTLDITNFLGIEKSSFQYRTTLIDNGPGQLVLNLYDSKENKLILDPREILTILYDKNDKYHKWELIANETDLEPGEWWKFPVYNDDVDAYQNMFNPKGTPEQVAKSISGCINQFNENFVAQAIDNNVYISTILKYEGANDFKFRRDLIKDHSIIENLLFYDIIPNIKTEDSTPEKIYYEQNFIGGNSQNKNRAIIDKEIGENIEINDWFQSQKNSFNQLKRFKINNEYVHILPYLEEPMYDFQDNFIGFKNISDYIIIQIENRKQFYTNHENYIVGYKTFSPSFSLLSVNPIKDFDFDFFYSKYSYTPVAELLKYFEFYNISAEEDQKYIDLTNNEFYKLVKGNNIKLEGFKDNKWEEIDIVLDAQIAGKSIFNTLPKSLKFNYDTRLYEYVNEYERFRIKREAFNDVVIIKFLYSEKLLELYEKNDREIISRNNVDYNIIEFEGFSGLEDIYNEADEENINLLINNEEFERFLYTILPSEYERLLENNIKDLVLKSRVVPYINKWINIGNDIYNNKYRLNISRVFGLTNFTPVEDIISDPGLFTHEWYYLDRHPENFPIDLMTNSRKYMFTKLDDKPFSNINSEDIDSKYAYKTWKELLYDTEIDFFTKYFTIGCPNDNSTEINLHRQREERFVFTEFLDSLGEVQCLFNGARIRIKELDELGNEIEESDFYKDYKFSAILTLKQSDDKYTNPYEIEIIDNRKFKCITFIVSVYLQDYKFNNFIDYVSLYTSKSAQSNNIVFNETIIKDFDNNNYDSNISNLNYDYIKCLGNQFITVCDYKDVEINSQISRSSEALYIIDKNRLLNNNFSSNEIKKIDSGNLQNVFALLNDPVYYSKIVSFEGFISIFSDEDPSFDLSLPTIVELNIDSYIIIRRCNIARVYRFSPFYPNIPKINKNISIEPRTSILDTNIYTTPIFYTKGYNLTENSNIIHNINNENRNIQQNYMLNGGKDFNIEILEKISFNNIKKLIQEKSKLVKYISVDEDNNNETKLLKNQFSLEFINPVELIKEEILRTRPDRDKPAELKSYDVIGYELETFDSYEKIQRYGGNFEPLTRDIILFNLNENIDFINYFNKDFMLLNTSINIDNEKSGTIKNLSINKVNRDEIIKVSESFAYRNVYPLVGHISIDNKDHNITLSSWDNNYYRNYIEKTEFEEKEGLVELKEIKSFLGSKVMNIPEFYNLDSFKEDEYNIRFIPPVGKNIISERDPVALDDGKPRVVIEIDLRKRLKRKMFDNNVNKEFLWIKENVKSSFKNLTNEEINLKVDEYLEKNILKLYNIDSLVIYDKIKTREKKFDIEDKEYRLERYCSIDFYKQLSEILEKNYQENKNYEFEIDENDPLKALITIEINTNEFKSFSLFTRIERI